MQAFALNHPITLLVQGIVLVLLGLLCLLFPLRVLHPRLGRRARHLHTGIGLALFRLCGVFVIVGSIPMLDLALRVFLRS